MNLSLENAIAGAAANAEKITGLPAPELGKIPTDEMNIVSLTVRFPAQIWQMENLAGYPVDDIVTSVTLLVPFPDVMEIVSGVQIDREWDGGSWQYEVDYTLDKFCGLEVETVGDSLHDEICQALIEEHYA